MVLFRVFVQLLQMEKTQARINHTLKTGKPLVIIAEDLDGNPIEVFEAD